MRTHRVGTLTLGATLVVFGLLFMARIFTISISYEWIMRLWPVILIFLGIEVLVSYFKDKEGKLLYDGGALFLMFLLSCFAIGMGCVEWLFHYAQYYSVSL